MKAKNLFFAAALLCLVACNNKGNEPAAPARSYTLTATIDLPQGQNAAVRKVSPELDKIAKDTLSFQWQMYDVLMVSQSGQKKPFVVTSISNDGVATLHGDFNGNLDDYAVSYGNQDSAVVSYISNSFDPMVEGTGIGKSFTLDSYHPVLKLSLKADVATNIYCIRYFVNNALKATLYCGDDLTVSTIDSTLVYFPIIGKATAGNAQVEFCSKSGLIMRKSLNMDVENSTLYNMPTLTIAQGSDEPLVPIEEETALKRKAAKPQREYSLDGGDTWEELTKDSSLKPKDGINPLIRITIGGKSYEFAMPLAEIGAEISAANKENGEW